MTPSARLRFSRSAPLSGTTFRPITASVEHPSLADRRRLFDVDRDHGFTLIELLVVIIIIGILAAIAIPIFLNQRKKGLDANAKSDLRNLAAFEEIYINDTESYGTIAQIQAREPQVNISHNVTISVVRYDAGKGYCLSAQASPSPNIWYYDSQGGGLQPAGSAGCPATTTGTPGDTVSG
jgi:type IV pilus assembly protein PilA